MDKIETNIQTGLTQKQAAERLRQFGKNILPEGKQDSWLLIFLHQFQSPLIYILLIAAIIIFFIGDHPLDAFIISGILFFNALIGTIQEGRTSNILASLKQFLQSKTVVIRDGAPHIVDDEEVVVGDLLLLKEGDRVPADAEIVFVEQLQIDEAILTGESKPVFKEKGDQAFKGTYIIGGSGKAVVTAIGTDTQVGKLQLTIEEINTDIPLRRELDHLSYIILLFILGMCITLLVIGILMGRQFNELLAMLTALFICVIPEGLPVVLTLVLVTGAYRMAKKNVLIRNLQGVESLGRTDVIVIDKTGTLTRNEMMVQAAYDGTQQYTVTGEGYFEKGHVQDNGTIAEPKPESHLGQMALASLLLNNAQFSFNKKFNLFEIKGDPTEAALFIFAQKVTTIQKALVTEYKKEYEIPFDSRRKYHAGFFQYDSKGVIFVAGAPEELFERGDDVPQSIKQECARMLEKGLRVIALARKSYNPSLFHGTQSEKDRFERGEKELTGLTILGLCGIQDTIRPEVAAMITDARNAGLKIIMATGDHKETAEHIAHEVCICQKDDAVLDGETLHALSDEELDHMIDSVTVFARVNPQDKVRIIQALHRKNYIVAMTGDGVNDVPSLVAADLGIAMGGIGTQVAKQAADLVLLDDSFVNIIRAIEQGRHIFYTLRRVVLYFFATNMGEILIVLFALFTRLPLPLTAAQILWLNFVTDGFLDVGLAMEPQEPDLLQAQWLKNRTRLVDKNLLIKMMYFAIPMGIASLIIFSWSYDGTPASIAYARTMTLITMAMFQWFNAWNCRSEGRSLFSIGLFSNRWLIAATLFVLSLQFAVCYIPFMHYIFRTVPLSFSDWVTIFALSSPIVVIEEIRKFVVKKISTIS